MKHILLTILLFTLQSELSFAEVKELTVDEVQILEYCIENVETNELCQNAIPVIIGGEGGGVPAGDKMKQEALAYIDVQDTDVLKARDYKQELGRVAFKELTGLDLSGNPRDQKLFKICLEEACGNQVMPNAVFGIIKENMLQNKTNLILSETSLAFRTIFGGEGGN